jgi:hypothetical protein
MPRPSRQEKVNEVKAIQRKDIELAHAKPPEPAPTPRKAPPVKTVGVGTIHQEVTGEKQDAPLMGEVIGPLHDYVDTIGFLFQSNPLGRAFRAELRAAMAPDVDWEENSMNLGGGFKRPPVVPLTMERPATQEERGSAITSTRTTVTVALPGGPAPRMPQYLRVLVWPLTRAEHFEGEATVELRHITRPEDVPSFPDRVRVPQGTSFGMELG